MKPPLPDFGKNEAPLSSFEGFKCPPFWGVVRHPSDFYYDFTTNEGSDLPYFAPFLKKCRIRKEKQDNGNRRFVSGWNGVLYRVYTLSCG